MTNDEPLHDDIIKAIINGYEQGLDIADLYDQFDGRVDWHNIETVYTTYEEIYKFAKKYPMYFGGISQARLLRILGDEDLARKIIRQYPKKLDAAQPVPVICVETGVVYKTMTEAAERHFVTAEALRKAVSENRKCVGFTFRKHERNNSVLRGRNANSARQQDADARQDD